MDKGRYLVEAHLVEGRRVAELAATHGVHPSWIYRLVARYRAEGDAGLIPRSRRPKTSPNALRSGLEEEIVRLRKQLTEEGLDAGAHTIQVHLKRHHDTAPSVSSIVRVLRRRGCVVPQPQKRPKSSFIRFEAALPNECWQSDMTHWSLADGTPVEIVNFIDDHSRLCVASMALPVTKATDVVALFQAARTRYGTPAAVLSDNGCIYTAKYRGGKVAMETELERLGVTFKHARPYHPQTCGKVERFHQTMKKYLAKQDSPNSLPELQTHIDRFVNYYNHHRPHRALARKTPQETFDIKVKAHPIVSDAQTHFRIRHDKVDKTGTVTVRYNSRLRHIGLGRAHAHTNVTVLVADLDIRVIHADTGELIRQLTLDPTRDYQPQSRS